MSIHKDKARGTWFVRYRIGNKQHSKRGFATKREAEAFEADQIRTVQHNTWTDPKRARMTVGELFTDWIASAQIQERTRSDYRCTYRNLIEPTWDKQQLRAVKAAGVSRWASSLSAEYSASSINQAVTIFNQMLKWAVADERLAVNPLQRAKELRGKSLVPRAAVCKDKRFLTHAEVAALAAAAGEAHALLILFMAYTGVRFGEVSALQVRDIDLLRNRVLVRRAFTDVSGKLLDVSPKSGQGRDIPLPELLRTPLLAHLGTLTGGPEALLFAAPEGGPLRYANFRKRIFDVATKAAGLSGVTPHELRHTYASLAIQAGANPKTLQKAMGHADIRLTLDTYGHLYPSDMDDLSTALDTAATEAAAKAKLKAASVPVSDTNVPKLFPRASAVAL